MTPPVGVRAADTGAPLPSRWLRGYLVVVVLAFAGAAAYLVLAAVPAVRDDAVHSWQRRLEALAEDRAGAIGQWAKERAGDAALVAGYPEVQAAVVASAARSAPPAGSTGAIGRFFRSFAETHDVERVAVMDGSLALVAAAGAAGDAASPACREAAATVLASGRPATLVDSVAGVPAALFAAPIGAAAGASRPAGIALVHADPQRWLYPFLGAGGGDASAEVSVETVLVTAGPVPRMLSPWRWHTGSLQQRVSAGLLPPPGAGGLSGAGRFGRARDEAGRPVWVAVRPVPGTEWLVVAIADEARVLAPVAPGVRRAAVVLVLLLAVSALAGTSLWRGERAAFYRRLAAQHAAARSDRGRAEAALAASEEKHRTILERLPVGTSSVRPDGTIEFVNPALIKLLGYTAADIPDLPTWLAAAFPDPEVRERAVQAMAASGRDGRTGERVATTWPVVTRDGRTRHIDFRVIDAGNRQVWTFSDVTPLRDALEELRASERKLRTLVQAIGEGIGIVDAEERFLLANPAAEALLGVPSGGLVGRSLEEFVASEAFAAMRRNTEHRRAGESGTYEVPMRRADGGECAVVVTATPLLGADGGFVGTIGVFRDVTGERRRSEQLLHGQKMEAVGRLAGGIAHDFNNLLQAMLNLTELLARRADSPEHAAAVAAELTEHVRRGAGLARQLLLFSRRHPTAYRALDLNDSVADTLAMLSRLLPANLAVRVELAPTRVPVSGDRGQLEQVLANLVLNAADAMPDGGSLAIRTAAADGAALLEVADTGCGIAPDALPRIFEPFFTTKSAEKGTGLGLSVVDGIVRQHGGVVTAESRVGAGSVFRVSLPLLAGAEELEGEHQPAGAPPVHRGRRVLVVEDEEELRRGLVDVLGLLGWQVEAVGSAEEAERCPRQPAFDVLLTDFLLPGKPGTALVEELRARWPDLRVVLMSGYTPDDAVRRRIDAGELAFLQKPFSLDDLNRAIGEAEDAA